ncbi:MAG: hypothetical protein IPM89_14340 [Candidatus Competibacteraceae bacterium]|nr:MAG: hypothetical protein IPM89_14340 [Candidatus Competibacteraceae bacterium]
MKKSFIAASGLALLMGSGIAMAQWNNESFPPFEEVDANQDGMVSMDEAKAHPGTVAAVTKGNSATVEDSMKSFFSAAHEKDKNKPYDSPMTKEEWEGVTGN